MSDLPSYLDHPLLAGFVSGDLKELGLKADAFFAPGPLVQRKFIERTPLTKTDWPGFGKHEFFGIDCPPKKYRGSAS